VISEAIEKAGYKLGKDIYAGARLRGERVYKAVNTIWRAKASNFSSSRSLPIIWRHSRRISDPVDRDGMDESDWDGWADLTKKAGHQIQLLAMIYSSLNTRILKEGIDKRYR